MQVAIKQRLFFQCNILRTNASTVEWSCPVLFSGSVFEMAGLISSSTMSRRLLTEMVGVRLMKEHIHVDVHTNTVSLTLSSSLSPLPPSFSTSLRTLHPQPLFHTPVILPASFHSPEVIFEQLSLIYSLPRYLVRSFRLILPFFPTATMERVDKEGQVVTAKVWSVNCVENGLC